MSIENILLERSESKCELCGSQIDLSVYKVTPIKEESADNAAYICANCQDQITDPDKCEVHHWRCLNDTMWSEVPAVQVIAWRMLTRLKSEGWPQDLLDMLYLSEETLAWAEATGEGADNEEASESIIHKDLNGVILAQGDSVVLIKDLNVKGAGFVAKRGTHVRNISLVHDNAEHIEGRVNGQHIVIITQYVKKA